MYRKAFLDLMGGFALWRVWLYQAWHEMTARYKRTALGSFWLAGQMVVTSLCLALVWGGLMGRNMHDVLPYIAGGILCFSLVALPLTQGPELFLGAGSMIRNHAYPYTYYVLENICQTTLTFAHNLVIYWIVIACFQASEFPHWTFLLGAPVVLVTVFTWGSVFGLIAARFRDLRFMLPFIGQLFFYLTPIVWRVNDISTKRAYISQYNPLYGLLEIMRAPLLGHAPPAQCWSLALGTMVTGCAIWLVVFPLYRKRIPFWV